MKKQESAKKLTPEAIEDEIETLREILQENRADSFNPILLQSKNGKTFEISLYMGRVMVCGERNEKNECNLTSLKDLIIQKNSEYYPPYTETGKKTYLNLRSSAKKVDEIKETASNEVKEVIEKI